MCVSWLCRVTQICYALYASAQIVYMMMKCGECSPRRWGYHANPKFGVRESLQYLTYFSFGYLSLYLRDRSPAVIEAFFSSLDGGSLFTACNIRNKLVKQIPRVVRTCARLRVVLNRKHRLLGEAYTCYSIIVEVNMRNFRIGC